MSKSLTENLIDIETTPEIKKYVWDVWQASKGAVPYKPTGHVHARMQYTAKHCSIKFPDYSKMTFYKYIDRNLN